MGVGIPAWHRGICSPWGLILRRVEISAKVSKMTEILRAKEKHLAPRGGQMERRRPATGHSTVAAHEVYKSCKFGGRSSINGGDMVHFSFVKTHRVSWCITRDYKLTKPESVYKLLAQNKIQYAISLLKL